MVSKEVMCMPRRAPRRKNSKTGSFVLRVPAEILEPFDKALDLNLIEGKSRNDAIVRLMRKALDNVFFVIQMFEKAEQELNNNPELRDLPPELLQVQLAGKILQESRNFEEWNREMATLIMTVAAKMDDPTFKEFVDALKKLDEGGAKKAICLPCTTRNSSHWRGYALRY